MILQKTKKGYKPINGTKVEVEVSKKLSRSRSRSRSLKRLSSGSIKEKKVVSKKKSKELLKKKSISVKKKSSRIIRKRSSIKVDRNTNKVSLMLKSENLKNNKFWTIERQGNTTTVKFGRMGAKTREK